MRKVTSTIIAALLTLGVVACQNEEPMDDMDGEMEQMDDADEMNEMEDMDGEMGDGEEM